jgi:hypothetical protein
MNATLNISIDTAMLALVTSSLNDEELAQLTRALVACACGEETEPFLNTSGLHIAFALLSPPITQSMQRIITLRANGAKGGRPRKHAKPSAEATEPTDLVSTNNGLVSSKKSKKEDLSPTPPIEEKNKKNKKITPSQSACAREEEPSETTLAVTRPELEPPPLEELQEQMLREQPWFDELCMSRRISQQDMAMYLMDFIKYLREQDARETLPHAKAHFVNQLPYIIKIYKTNLNHDNNQKFITDRVARREFERESRRQEVCDALTELAAQSQQPAIDPF